LTHHEINSEVFFLIDGKFFTSILMGNNVNKFHSGFSKMETPKYCRSNSGFVIYLYSLNLSG